MIHKGRGISTIFYPSGFNGGGDPDVAYIRIKTDGTLVVSNASCEMGQGLKNVAVQIAAETLQIDVDRFTFDNGDSDNAAFSMDTAGTRSTVIMGNAVKFACEDFIKKSKALAAGAFGVTIEELDYADGAVFVKADPEKKMTINDIGAASNYGAAAIVGIGSFLPEPGAPRDPETGFTTPSKILGYGSSVIDVEVDDETGVVTVKNIYTCYDMGTVINRAAAEGQADGGNIQGMGFTLYEDIAPYFPGNMDIQTASFTDYIIPTYADMPVISKTDFYENPDPIGPYGAKGCGEMVVDTQAPAIVNAIYDAVGVWMHDMPATPEKVLRAIKEKNAK